LISLASAACDLDDGAELASFRAQNGPQTIEDGLSVALLVAQELGPGRQRRHRS